MHEESDRRSIDSGIQKVLWKFVRWRSLEDTVEGRPLEGSGGNLSVGGVWREFVRWSPVGTVEG